MIDITIDEQLMTCAVENITFDIHPGDGYINNLKQLIIKIVDAAKYSGESITLWVAKNDETEMKHLVGEW